MAQLSTDQRTITWDEVYNAWTSFHTYIPEWTQRLGTKFYTFKNGNLYEHDANEERTNFYGSIDGCRIKFSANEGPSDVKLFKALGLETNSTQWYATLNSELESGQIGSAGNYKFEDKEGMKYAYIRREASDKNNYNKLSVQGIGPVTGGGGPTEIVFGNAIPNQIQEGDELWFDNSGTPLQVGVIDTISGSSINVVAIINAPSVNDFCFVVKDPQVESYGLRGYYSSILLQNDSTNFVELYAVNSEVFKSYM